MRMTGVVAAGVLCIELLLAGAFALGFYWLGGVQWGLLFSGVLLLLMVLPWLGELKLVFDSAGPRGGVKVGWWGRASFSTGDTVTRVIVRVIGIPIRREIERKSSKADEEEPAGEAAVSPEFEPAAEEMVEEEKSEDIGVTEERDEAASVARLGSIWKRIDSETIERFCRVIGSALGATCELVWGADEIRVLVENPSEHQIADLTVEQVFGRREVGPADVSICTAEGPRRVRAVYRIGLLRAALAGLQVVIDGRVREFTGTMKGAGDRAEAVGEDERIIEEILDRDGPCEEDED